MGCAIPNDGNGPPAPKPRRPEDESGGSATDLTKTTASGISLLCKVGESATQFVPFGLSKDAERELRESCGRISKQAERTTKDIQAFASGEYNNISDKTKKEIAEAVAKLARENSMADPGRPFCEPTASSPDSVSRVARGTGSRKEISLKKLLIPLRYANTTDVHLLVNYDLNKVMSGDVKPLGVGVGARHRMRNGTVSGGLFVDTSKSKTEFGGYIELSLTIPGF